MFVLCASNLPWELDTALLRRLEKRVLVPLPNEAARLHMFANNLTPDRTSPEVDFSSIAAETEGYSGSDIRLICKEVSRVPY